MLLLLLLLLLLASGSAGEAACPTVTRVTLYGVEELVCSGRGICSADNKHCTCEDGAQTARRRGPGWRDMWWQTEPGNIRANGGDCGGTLHAAASPQQISHHYTLLVVTYAGLCFVCGLLFARPVRCCPHFLHPPRFRLHAEPWRLPVAATVTGVGTLAATVISALLAGGGCDCYWIHDFDKYKTISALAEHAPMTVITPVGVLITSFFATAQIFATIKRAAVLPCYKDSVLAKVALALWSLCAANAAFWGIGVNVFFNESWDHDSHIDLSMNYFVAAGFNNIFLYFAILPRIWVEHRAPIVCRNYVIQLAFHGLWISPTIGLTYYWVYAGWKEKPPYVLGVFEHCMSTYELVSNGIVLVCMLY